MSVVATGGVETEVTIEGVDYVVHTFTEAGTFEVLSGPLDVDVLLIGGGGAGGANNTGAGGGAGEFLKVLGKSVSAGEHSVSIGAGGVGISDNARGEAGEDTTVFDLTAIGGGGGGGDAWSSATEKPGGDGGSGGGGGGGRGSFSSTVECAGGESIATSGLGNDGGNGNDTDFTASRSGGGGGGAGSAGSNAGSSGGNGGDPVSDDFDGTEKEYAAGGGGATNSGTRGLGGGTVGGDGGNPDGTTNGTDGTGSGGGGLGEGGSDVAGDGGSGIVIIRYELPEGGGTGDAGTGTGSGTGTGTGTGTGSSSSTGVAPGIIPLNLYLVSITLPDIPTEEEEPEEAAVELGVAVKQSLLEHWSLEEGEGTDTVGDLNGNDLENFTATWADGMVGDHSLGPGGTAARIKDNAGFANMREKDFWCSVWVRPTIGTTGHVMGRWGPDGVTGRQQWHIQIDSGKVQLEVDTSGGSNDGIVVAETAALITEIDAKYHIATMFEWETGRARIWVDGVLVADNTVGETVLFNISAGSTKRFTLRQRDESSSGTWRWDGDTDHAAMGTDAVIGQDDVDWLYNNGAGRLWPEYGLDDA